MVAPGTDVWDQRPLPSRQSTRRANNEAAALREGTIGSTRKAKRPFVFVCVLRTIDYMDNHTKILVAYATAAGSTKGVANFIADKLRRDGFLVDVQSVNEAPDPEAFDAVILGSAVHNRAWLPEAELYLYKYRDVLSHKGVWLFSVSLSASLRGPIGRVLRRAVPKKIAALIRDARARDYQAFAGVFERDGTTAVTRVICWVIGGGRYGDLRDWPEIANWASVISAGLRTHVVAGGESVVARVVAQEVE